MSSRSNRRAFAALTTAALLAVLGGCTTGGPILTGSSSTTLGSGTSSATPTPTPTPAATPTPTATPVATPIPGTGSAPITISEGQLALDGGYIAVFTPFTLAGAGSLDLVADWLSPLDDIDIGIASGECTTAMMQAGTCVFAAIADSATAKPEEIVLPVSAGTYTHVIGNFTASTEIITFRLVFTPTTSLSATKAAEVAAGLSVQAMKSTEFTRARGGLKR